MGAVLIRGHVMELQNQTALVTGGGSGIGRAVALALADAGAFLIVTGRDGSRLAQVVTQIKATGGDARAIPADIGDLDSLRRLVEESGQVDILVNNAGVYPFAPTLEQRVDDFDQMFDTNVRGPFFLTAALAAKTVTKGAGTIINVTSTAGLRGLRDAAAYGATKAVLDSLTRAWAAELGGSGVRVNSVAPGTIRTDHALKARGETDYEAAGRTGNPLGRLGRPNDVADAVLFLASPHADYITGVTLPVDGGPPPGADQWEPRSRT
jgi:NAD(P)-dependent dehydrogenase (short-subunit alcohol dehydrogenase family)